MAESRFFDIDCILAEDEKVDCDILIDAFNLERLEFQYLPLDFPSQPQRPQPTQQASSLNEEPNQVQESNGPTRRIEKDQDDIECYMVKGTKFKIPLWMAISLAAHRFLTIQLPKYYDQEFINMVLSHPEGVNLCEKNYYYYELGAIMAKKLNRNSIPDYLAKIFLTRIKQIFVFVFHNSNDATPANNFLQKLTNIEHVFFEKGKRSMIIHNVWNSGKTLEHLQTNSFLSRKKVKTT
jgi:hypothetical protein